MRASPLVSQILRDEGLTRRLNDPEARLLVEWLVDQVEQAPADEPPHGAARLVHRARAISKFVALWCHQHDRGAAAQLAATERFAWPLPNGSIDPCDLMQAILSWEARHMRLLSRAGALD
jgi:hypothetical protein